MTGPISPDRLLGSLKEAASWPGADRNTVVTLAAALVGPGCATVCFSGVTYAKLSPVARVLCAVADRCCQPLAAAVALTVANLRQALASCYFRGPCPPWTSISSLITDRST